MKYLVLVLDQGAVPSFDLVELEAPSEDDDGEWQEALDKMYQAKSAMPQTVMGIPLTPQNINKLRASDIARVIKDEDLTVYTPEAIKGMRECPSCKQPIAFLKKVIIREKYFEVKADDRFETGKLSLTYHESGPKSAPHDDVKLHLQNQDDHTKGDYECPRCRKVVARNRKQAEDILIGGKE